ncbi:LPXTG cell wall anchor domain-containing protein, partial [Enterococcus faecalis]
MYKRSTNTSESKGGFKMKKKRYLMIVCLLSSPSFFINVE